MYLEPLLDDPESCAQGMHLGQQRMTCQIQSLLTPGRVSLKLKIIEELVDLYKIPYFLD